MEAEHPAPSRSTTLLIRATTLLTALVLIVAVISLTMTFDSSASTSEVRRSTEIASCRSELRVQIDLADSAVNNLILDGLGAVALEDMEQLEAILELAPIVKEERTEAVKRYDEGIKLQQRDETEFIRQCRDGL